MDLSSYFPDRGILNASHIANGARTVTIAGVKIETVGQDEKPVVRFVELERGLALNKTNYLVLVEAYGAESDDWHGRQVILFVEKVSFNGKDVDSIKIRIDQNNWLPRNQRSTPKPPPPPQDDAEVPF
jgi:hypothetical protein